MKRIYLTVKDDGLEVIYGEPNGRVEDRALITHAKELHEFFLAHPDTDLVLCSSSLDFPEEYTSNKEIIELCDDIRNG
jgi:hypothetical protein